MIQLGTSKIWDFFENINALVYVSDMDTYELVYMNQRARETYNIGSNDELRGRKCYELLQHACAPCAMCTNRELRPGYFKEWDYYNPIIDKTIDLKDTMIIDGGRRLRMEMAFDKSRQAAAADSYRSLEAISNEGMRLAMRVSSPDESLNIILEYLGKALHGERAYIFERNAAGNDDNTYEWVAAGVTPEKDNLQNVAAEVCAGWYKRFHQNENIIIPDVEDCRVSDPPVYELLTVQNIHSAVEVPLYDGDRIIGFYGVDNPPADILEYVSDALQITGHFLVAMIKRRDLLKRLEIISFHDHLTQLGNRYSMKEYVQVLSGEESLGVVYCDINGLKKVNDTEGHAAGDRLILRACECLTMAFEGYGLFRIGGDELLALCAGISRNELEERIEKLKIEQGIQNVAMAVGCAWYEKGNLGIDKVLREAEMRMYEAKDAYYKVYGIDRRK